MGPIIVMGVSGSGKTMFGTALAERLGVVFIEGDTLHPPENVAKMSAGTPLTDEDRWPWLQAICRALAGKDGAVASCSALKLTYRNRLRAGLWPAARFICLAIPRPELELRMSERRGHFMPATLLDSQLATFEPPDSEADALIVDGTAPQELNVDLAVTWLQSNSGETAW